MDIRKLQQRLAKIEADIGGVADDFAMLAAKRTANGSSTPRSKPPAKHRPRPHPDAPAGTAKRLAELGVSSVLIERHADDSATVMIEQYRPFHLSAKLAVLLDALCENVPASTDKFVVWKSIQQLAGRLSANGHAGAAIPQAIWLLRNSLAEAGLNRYWVQSHPRLGYRFAKRVGLDNVIKHDLM